MSYRVIQILTVVLPTILIGGFEFIRHGFLLGHMSMETGNVLITLQVKPISKLHRDWSLQKIR